MFIFNIKNILKLQKSKKIREKKNTIIVEGLQEIKMAFKSSLILNNILICKNIFFKKKKDFSILKKYKNILYINKVIYNKIVYRKNTEGIIGIFKINKINYEKKFLKLIKNKKKIILLILDSIEKPGNIGAIIRTIEASNIVDSIIINYDKDIYNPNIIRSSLGCIFILSIILLPIKKILYYIKKYKFTLFGTYISKKYNSKYLYEVYFNKYPKIAIIFGNENKGISNVWKNLIFKNLYIPMYGTINSLNVSVAVAIIIFELLRQKKFN